MIVRLRRSLAIGAFGALACHAGCAGTETGNAADGVPVILSVSIATTALPDADDQVFAVERARGYIRRIDLDLPDGMTCADVGAALVGGICVDDRIRFEGPWTVDLLTGELDPPAPEMRVPAGRYARIDVRFVPDDDDVSLLVEGIAPGDERFRLLGDFSEDGRFEGDAAVIDADAPIAVRLVMPVAAWFAHAPLAECIAAGDVPRDGEGTALITEDLDDPCDEVVDDVRDSMKRDGRID